MRVAYLPHGDNMSSTCLVALEGRKYVHVIPMDSGGLRIRKLTIKEAGGLRDIPGYPVERAVARFSQAAQRFGITVAARHHIETFTGEPLNAPSIGLDRGNAEQQEHPADGSS